ncbi:5'-3' exonuclease H3TH domain-containing protein [Polyangium sp. y55x31]|uniref:5'-3' exonuclease n=1 Tax=Polyangium sp. y55x31 TaxID=3042688 RepID=UPI002482365A|nr:5'-3' exonuclease H3TH domain-containing protein [Polyangium sp. y55x31]MDI1475251.1 5'-3' exonuclease H3TH domain-containing protein [Polyangium sp. y55x31]
MRTADPARPRLHLVDATYELFRAYFAQPSRKAPDGREVGAVRGLLSTLMVLTREATHIACATDHVVRSFRNDLYAGYKTGDGLAEELTSQFLLAEDAMRALGLVVWPMVEFEADDAIAAGAARFSEEAGQVLIASVDKDLAQCVDGTRVVMLDRKNDNAVLDEDGVTRKFGVKPASIPDFLALVGDSADGYPGLPGWGEKSAAAVLSAFGTIERIPREASAWGIKVRGADKLAQTLAAQTDEARLFKQLATLRTDVPLIESFEDLAYRGARPELRAFCESLGMPDLVKRVTRWCS